MRHLLIAFCGLVVFVMPTHSSPQAKDDAPSEGFRVVGTMRTLNTAEYAYKYGNADQKFGEKDEIAEFLRTEGRNSPPLIDLEHSAPYEIKIVTDADRTHYWISTKPERDPNIKLSGCGPAAFSDDVGVIYTGTALGCEDSKTVARTN